MPEKRKNRIRKRIRIIDEEENMTQKKSLTLAFIFLFAYSCGKERAETPAKYVRAIEAHKYIGDVKTVCGKVVESRFVSSGRGHQTFLSIDRPYSNPLFLIVILGNDRINFDSPPEVYYLYESICVTGKIQSHEGVAQIEIKDPKQILITRN